MEVVVACKLLNRSLELRLDPLVRLAEVTRIVVVRETAGPPIPKVEYRSPPAWAVRRPLGWMGQLLRLAILLRACRRGHPGAAIGIFLVPHGLFAVLAGRLFGLPAIVSIIGSDLHRHLAGGPVRRSALLPWLRRARWVSTSGAATRETLVALGLDPARVVVLLHAVDDRRFAPRPPAGPPIDLVSVARLVEGKGGAELVELVRRIAVRRPDVTAALLGDGPLLPAIRGDAAEAGIADRFATPGFVEDVERWLSRARLFVLLSRAEGLPYAAIEAMACGVPCVVTAVGDVEDLVRDGVNGLVVRLPIDWALLEGKIAALLSDEPRRAAMGRAARETVEQSFSRAAADGAWRRMLDLDVEGNDR